MSVTPFDPLKDKITEKELVPDILERLSFGKELSNGANEYASKGTKLVDVLIGVLQASLPQNVISHFKNVHVDTLHIQANHRFATKIIHDLKECKLLYAVSQQTGIDMTSYIMTLNTSPGSLTCTFSSDVPYLSDDTITIYTC